MMATQQEKPLPGQPRTVEPRTQKAEAAAPPHPQLEVLQERMNHLATREQVDAINARMDQMATREQMDATNARIDATNAQMYKLHGEAMERINQVAASVDVLQERTKQMATKAEMHKLHNETMERMNDLHLAAMDRSGRLEARVGRMESDLKFIKWIGSTLGVAIIAGLVKIIFFLPV